MTDQKEFWKKKREVLADYSDQPTTFAKEVISTFPASSCILDLGTGEGNDAIYFAGQGHTVIATDFLEDLVEQGRQRYHHSHLQFTRQDISQPFAFKDSEFDVVYARLSLHYFTDAVTRQACAEIARVLKPGGRFCFMCKSIDDFRYGDGTEIEPDMFEREGHVRHFFSEAYARDLLAKDFIIDSLTTGSEQMYGKISGFVKAIAVRK